MAIDVIRELVLTLPPPPDGQQQKQQPAMNRPMPNTTNQTPAAAVKPTD
jgi:hypothetical protein